MAQLILNTEDTTIFVGSDATVTPIVDFETKEPSTDKETGLPLYKVNVEIISGGEVSQVAMKVASKDAFTLAPRSEYKVNGKLIAVPWLADGSKRVSISYKVVGSLVAVKATRSE